LSEPIDSMSLVKVSNLLTKRKPHRSYSSAEIPLWLKLGELRIFYRLLSAKNRAHHNVARVFEDLEEYDSLLKKYTSRSLTQSKAFEIGFGARPNRLIALLCQSVDVSGVDLEQPVLRGSLVEFWQIFKTYGFERGAKSLIRHLLIDREERRVLTKSLLANGKQLNIPPEGFIIDDISNVKLPAGSLDLILSEDVFEHIAVANLDALLVKMSRWLKPNGLALVRPNVFTGITGGHLAEWFAELVTVSKWPRKSEPWEHLRKNRFPANVYLNRLSRRQYRQLFSREFDILEERVRNRDLGKEFMSEDLRQELRDYPDDELFSNQVLFVLRPALR
jgi:hypothetical protein